MIEKLRVIVHPPQQRALSSAAKTLRNDPVLQDWWLVRRRLPDLGLFRSEISSAIRGTADPLIA